MSLFFSIARAINHYHFLTPSYNRLQCLYHYQLPTDHIAVRTFQSDGGIQLFKDALLKNGVYNSGGTLEIPEKHLNAEWFHTQDPELRKIAPRIFVSEIEESHLSPTSREIINKTLKKGIGVMSSIDYDEINKESEYAGWSLVHRRSVNHVAVNIPENTNIHTFVEEQKSRNFNINNIGGEIKTSKDGMLHQASVMSDIVKHTFVNDDGSLNEERYIPGFFVEFVQRDKYKGNSIREGFESRNALHIFDSTRGASPARKSTRCASPARKSTRTSSKKD